MCNWVLVMRTVLSLIPQAYSLQLFLSFILFFIVSSVIGTEILHAFTSQRVDESTIPARETQQIENDENEETGSEGLADIIMVGVSQVQDNIYPNAQDNRIPETLFSINGSTN
ncbi:MAG: hypothetical protein EZS28_000028 [Streblomastix strix]|uniref:Uncharacterized protein n=1 Tax=Streblomastix strix TaxID=222440 RepID=A0A5J4XBX4_9EUKA|nr:MAG: hypothetical protein EZS28_000028 [Streblomastix strix]